MSVSQPVLHLENINKTFSGVQVLKDINIDFMPGEVHCLMGENGAGKSTLIKIISGAYTPDAGAVMVYQGQPVEHNSPHWARAHGINAIYQEIDLVPDLNAVENVMLGNEPQKKNGAIDWEESRRRTTEVLKEMGMEIDLDCPVGQLKVAQQQMVAIARALLLDSKLIIFDEPTAVFTENEVTMLFRLIARLKERGMAILYISHHLDEIFEIGDRVTILRDGTLVKTDVVSAFTRDSMINLMVGRNIDMTQRFGRPSDGETVLEVKGLSQEGVVQDISFCLHAGEILGFGGLVGAGRTEMARLLIGLERRTSGEILLNGEPVKFASPRQALMHRVGMLLESRKEEGLVLVRTVSENMMYNYIEMFFKKGLVKWKQVRQKVAEQMKSLNVRPNDPNKVIQYLSGGNQQKVALGKLMAADCNIWILDEPTRGVDVGARTEIYQLMRAARDEGKAIVMITSDMTELLTQSDRILIMSGGTIAGELDPASVTEVEVLSMALGEGGKNE